MGDRGALHSLLERFSAVQCNDIHDVARGHLNENKLRKKHNVSEAKENFWTSSKKEPVWMRQKVVLKDHPKQLPPLERKEGHQTPGSQNERRKDGGDCSVGGNSRKRATEELTYPDIMIPVPNSKAKFSHEFVPSPLMFPTKGEQYRQFQRSGNQLLKGRDVFADELDQNVSLIETRMQQRLHSLEVEQDLSIPNYFKFKIFSDAWDELNTVLGDDAQRFDSIKSDYDNYVSALLEEQISLHDQCTLEEYTALLKLQESEEEERNVGDDDGSGNGNRDVEDETLRQLEDDMLEELKENERLREQLKSALDDKTEVVRQYEESTREDASELPEEVIRSDDLETRVITLHVQIEEKYKEIEKLKKNQKEKCVPRAVYQRLEQCIKEIEVDVQKLKKQNDFLEQDIQELEVELEKVLVKTGIKAKDAKFLWRRVSMSRLLNW